MANKFNPLDPLGIVKTAKDQVDTMAVQAGLPPTPRMPGLPARGTTRARLLDPLGLFNRENTKVEDRGFSHDRGY